jgi:hypothetical protein
MEITNHLTKIITYLSEIEKYANITELNKNCFTYYHYKYIKQSIHWLTSNKILITCKEQDVKYKTRKLSPNTTYYSINPKFIELRT